MDSSDFRGKRYLVTGVGSGIGRSLAIQLSSMGAEVWGVSKTKANLDSLTVSKNLANFMTFYEFVFRKNAHLYMLSI